jgi:hypothetical protein
MTMGGFDPVIQALVQAVIDAGAASTDGNVITAQFVGHSDAWHTPPTHQLFQKTRCCASIPAALHENFQHITLGVDSTPEPVFLSGDGDNDFIEMPFVRSRGSIATDSGCDLRPKATAPHADCFVADREPTFGPQILDVAKAECKSVIRPDRISDDRTWKTKTFPDYLPCSAVFRLVQNRNIVV